MYAAPIRSRIEHVWSSVGPRSRGLLEDEAGPLEAVPDDGEEQLPLRPEQLEQVRLRDADRAGRSIGRGAGVAAARRTRGAPATTIASRRSSAVWRVVAVAFMPRNLVSTK